MKIYCLAGPSASGKSTTLKVLEKDFDTLQEKYMELNIYELDNRLILSKWKYIDYWFSSVLDAKNKGMSIIITDRCPIDTCAYVKSEDLALLRCIAQSFKELKQLGITLKTILLTADFEILEKRIIERIKHDERRINYNELDRNHNLKAFNFFEKNKEIFDYTINTSFLSIEQVVEQIKANF